MNRKVLLRRRLCYAASALLIVVALIYAAPIMRFVLLVAADKYYTMTAACDENGENCATITYESHASLNSPINKYLFTGYWISIPMFNHRYVMFENGVEFCFVGTPDGRYEIHSTAPPSVNNLAELVELSPVKIKDSACRQNVY